MVLEAKNALCNNGNKKQLMCCCSLSIGSMLPTRQFPACNNVLSTLKTTERFCYNFNRVLQLYFHQLEVTVDALKAHIEIGTRRNGIYVSNQLQRFPAIPRRSTGLDL
uniref:Uncharacterized protein n=1 Tax=Globodera rostochiensis TaxID=31243 RepID=A0A914H8Z5_GLORO